MAEPPAFDVAAAHRFFAADCFNRAWDLLDKPERTPREALLLVALNQASLFHWLQRPDVTERNLSVGCWQASRIHAALGHWAEAGRYAALCRELSIDLEPFYLAYAHEALARAAQGGGDAAAAEEHLGRAEVLAAAVAEPEEREMLLADLQGLRAKAR